MKLESTTKSVPKFLIIGGILFASLIGISTFLYILNPPEKNPESCRWNIHIIGNSGWIAFKNAGKCTGEGTQSDPYLIEDLEIDGTGCESCILIEDSDVYFIIQNCKIYNSQGYPNSGIRLYEVVNGILLNNTCSSNYNGINLYDCQSITINDNFLINNLYGIKIQYSENSLVQGNLVINNSRYGMELDWSDNNTLSGNIVINNNLKGIFVHSHSKYNTISYNNLTENALALTSCGFTVMKGNQMNQCGLFITEMPYKYSYSHKIDTTNLVNEKILYYYASKNNLGPNNFINAGQVVLGNCNNSIVEDLDISDVSIGISLLYCNNNTVFRNNAINNKYYGLHLYFSDNNNILMNNMSNNEKYGVYFYGSDNNNISSNNANYNSIAGICLEGSVGINISNNTVNENEFGIYLHSFDSGFFYDIHNHDINILGNEAENNFYGIWIGGGSGNSLSENSFEGCGLYINPRSNDPVSSLQDVLRSHHIEASNIVNGKPLYFYEDESNLQSSNFTNAGQIILNNCSNSFIENLDVSNSSVGVLFAKCKNIIISQIKSCNNMIGIYTYESYNISISENEISQNDLYGILFILGCEHNSILKNDICNNKNYGICLKNCDYNSIFENNVNNNKIYGIYLHFSNYNDIMNNILFNNSECIGEYECQGNIFSDNGSCSYPNPIISSYNLILIPLTLSIIFIRKIKCR